MAPRLLHLERSRVESGNLGGHQTVVCFIGVGATIGFGEERSIGPPLHVHCFSDDEGVLSRYFKAAGATLRRRLDDLGVHVAESLASFYNLPIRGEEFNIVGELSHQAIPVAIAEGCQVFRNHLLGTRLSFQRQ